MVYKFDSDSIMTMTKCEFFTTTSYILINSYYLFIDTNLSNIFDHKVLLLHKIIPNFYIYVIQIRCYFSMKLFITCALHMQNILYHVHNSGFFIGRCSKHNFTSYKHAITFHLKNTYVNLRHSTKLFIIVWYMRIYPKKHISRFWQRFFQGGDSKHNFYIFVIQIWYYISFKVRYMNKFKAFMNLFTIFLVKIFKEPKHNFRISTIQIYSHFLICAYRIYSLSYDIRQHT